MVSTKINSLKVCVIGAGIRGFNLARQLSTSDIPAKIIGVAEPNPNKKQLFANEFNLDDKYSFNDWQELVNSHIPCDAAIIATLDNQHTEPALAALDNGWHVLLEKPLSDHYEGCCQIVAKQKETGQVLSVCHSLRYMDAFVKVKNLIDNKVIGEIVHIEHMEGIGHFRFAHNYVRGRWAVKENNTFLLLHKCCHDIDYIYWLMNTRCERVSSFGSLKYFTTENAMQKNVSRCIDCDLKESCQYSALRIYVDGKLDEWPARDICEQHTKDAHYKAVSNGPYGKCVWAGTNDVVDHQVVMMEFKNGATATSTLTGYSATNGRRLRIQGTLGELLYDEAQRTILISKFFEEKSEIISIPENNLYHPEDRDIVNNWLLSISSSEPQIAVDAQEAMKSHAIVFAAEKSRLEKRTIEMSEFYPD